jgi:hypothetical protein
MEKVTNLAHEIIEMVDRTNLSQIEKLSAFKIAEQILSLQRAQEIVNRYPESGHALAEASAFLSSQ